MCRRLSSTGPGGVRSQLNRLRAGLHPVTRIRLPQTTWADGSAVAEARGYLRKVGSTEAVADKFVPYVAEEFRLMEQVQPAGMTSKDKMRLRRGRVLLKMAVAASTARAEKRKEDNRKAAELVASFIRAVDAENDIVEKQAADDVLDDDGAAFWNELEPMASGKLSDFPCGPVQFSRRPKPPSRVSRLVANLATCDSRGVNCRCGRPAMH